MDKSPSVEKILAALKQELRLKGLRNRDVASHLNVSEPTVKRYLRGQGLDLSTLEKLAEIVDLDLMSLLASAQRHNPPKPMLSMTQQEALKRSALLRAVFALLSRGMTPTHVGKELELTPQKLDMLLAKLQGLQLIRTRAGDRVEILAAGSGFEFNAKAKSPLVDVAREFAGRFLSDINLKDESCEWIYDAASLSPASVARVDELIERVVGEIRRLSMIDIVPARGNRIYQYFFAAQPTSRDRFLPHA